MSVCITIRSNYHFHLLRVSCVSFHLHLSELPFTFVRVLIYICQRFHLHLLEVPFTFVTGSIFIYLRFHLHLSEVPFTLVNATGSLYICHWFNLRKFFHIISLRSRFRIPIYNYMIRTPGFYS